MRTPPDLPRVDAQASATRRPASRSKILRDTFVGLALAVAGLSIMAYVGWQFQRTSERRAVERSVKHIASHRDYLESLQRRLVLVETFDESDGRKAASVTTAFFSQMRVEQLGQLERIWRFGRQPGDDSPLVVYLWSDGDRERWGEYSPTTGLVQDR